jgi:hypothetical protein
MTRAAVEQSVQNSTGIAYGHTSATVRALAATGRGSGRLTFNTLLSRLGHDRVRTVPSEEERIELAFSELIEAARRSGGVRRRARRPTAAG